MAFIRKAALSAYSRNHAGEVKETFNEPDSMCAAVRAAADKWTEIIREASQSNPNLVRAQWEILHLAGDFHPGWKAALIQVEDMYYDEMVNKRAKRSDRKVTTEVNGARDRALRKIKSDLDHAPQTGESFTPGECPWCYPAPEILDEWNRNMAKHFARFDAEMKSPKQNPFSYRPQRFFGFRTL